MNPLYPLVCPHGVPDSCDHAHPTFADRVTTTGTQVVATVWCGVCQHRVQQVYAPVSPRSHPHLTGRYARVASTVLV